MSEDIVYNSMIVAVIKEIKAAENQVFEAFNSGTLDPADHYTEDC